MDYKVFFDTNILLEIIFLRKKYKECRDLLEKNSDNVYISILSIHICNYFVKKHNLDVNYYKKFFDYFEIIDFNSDIFDKAYFNYSKDFEDSIQIASALSVQCNQFITLDKKLKNNYGNLLNIITLI